MRTSGTLTPAWLLAWLLCCACGAAAQDLPSPPPNPAAGIPLKLQRWLIPLAPSQPGEVLPMFLKAQELQGHQGAEIEATGEVELRRRGQVFYSDWLRYDQVTDDVNAKGNVRIEQGPDVMNGETLHYNMTSGQGELSAPQYELFANQALGHGSGDTLYLESNSRYRLVNGDYTTCGPDNPDWVIRSDSLVLDKDKQEGTARNARIIFKGVPILYSPYLSFSLDQSRKSGFLSPSIGSSSRTGFDTSIPYYWNIAPERDATFTPRYMAKRGFELSTEFRYLDPTYHGTFRFEFLPDDDAKGGRFRDALWFNHTQVWSTGWYMSAEAQRVSDDTYFTDLSTQLAFTSLSVLPADLTVGRAGTWGNSGTWTLQGMAQAWQTLQPDPLQPVTAPYDRLPQLTFTAAQYDLGPFDFDFASSYTDFQNKTLTSGQRGVVYPSFSLPIENAYAYFTPKIGVHYTHYALERQTTTLPADSSRTLPILTVDSGLTFERDMSWFGRGLTQTLEPRLYYVYIPNKDQNQLPNFDSAPQDLNFSTLFVENQFSGSDRINDANQMTFGVTSRFLEQNGAERLRLGLAQRYYFSDQEVTVPGFPARSSDASDLLALISGYITPSWSVNSGWQYTTDLSQTQRFEIGARYEPEKGKLLNIAYRYNATTAQLGAPLLKQVDLSAQWPITQRINAVARWNYSLPDRKLLEGIAGFEYNACCWTLRFVAHSFATATQDKVTSVMLLLELNGVTELGSNPLQLLRRNIAGYAPLTRAGANVNDDPLITP